jgi:TIR domain
MHVFISYNKNDRELAGALAVQLRLVGIDVFLDAWEIEPGDSIPGKVNSALALVDLVLVLWSEDAARSRWVGAELETALALHLEDSSVRVIPVRLDASPLPSLLRPFKWLRLEDEGQASDVARQLAGIGSPEEFLKAVQQTLEESGLEVGYFEGYGPAVGCPKCGAPLSELSGWSQVDERRDDLYAGVRCGRCGWNDGGEI